MATVPQFGEPQPGLTYKDRPAAFGILERDGLIALVEVTKAGKVWRDLPGGAIDPGEVAAQAVVREFGEETGLKISVAEPYAQADQYFLNTDGRPFDNRATFFPATLVAEAPDLKIEDDHELIWMDPHGAIEALRHDAHSWAVSAWLRRVKASA